MEARINNGKDNYLHCSVDCQVSNYQDQYNSSEECISAIKDEIIAECAERGYSEFETEKVISHYEIKFSNNVGVWKNSYYK